MNKLIINIWNDNIVWLKNKSNEATFLKFRANVCLDWILKRIQIIIIGLRRDLRPYRLQKYPFTIATTTMSERRNTSQDWTELLTIVLTVDSWQTPTVRIIEFILRSCFVSSSSARLRRNPKLKRKVLRFISSGVHSGFDDSLCITAEFVPSDR